MKDFNTILGACRFPSKQTFCIGERSLLTVEVTASPIPNIMTVTFFHLLNLSYQHYQATRKQRPSLRSSPAWPLVTEVQSDELSSPTQGNQYWAPYGPPDNSNQCSWSCDSFCTTAWLYLSGWTMGGAPQAEFFKASC